MPNWFAKLFGRPADKATTASSIIADAPSGLGTHTPSLNRAQEQYKHCVGWPSVAIRAISWRIAAQDVCVARLTRRRTRKRWTPQDAPRWVKALGDQLAPLESHALLDAVNRPNPIMTKSALMISTVGSLELTGRSFWWMPDGDEGPEIWPLPSSWVQPADVLRGSYKIRARHSGQEFTVPAEQVAMFVLPDPSDPFGSKSPLQTQAPAIAADEAIQVAQARGFKNGLYPGLLIRAGRHPDVTGQPGMRPVLTKSQRKDLVNSIRTICEGAANYGEPLILDGMIESVDKITNSVQEMDFLSSGKQTKSRIMQAFGVNPLVVGEVENANRAQAVVADKTFVANCVNPLLTLLSEAMTRWVAPRFAADGERLVAWISPAVAADPELDLQRWALALKSASVTVNEFRAGVMNLPAVEGGDDPSGNSVVWRALGGAETRLAE